jgi:hypothetical protein
MLTSNITFSHSSSLKSMLSVEGRKSATASVFGLLYKEILEDL